MTERDEGSQEPQQPDNSGQNDNEVVREPYRMLEGKLYLDSEVFPGLKPLKLSAEEEQGVMELDRFEEQLLPYYHRFMVYVATVKDPKSPSHPDRMRETGLRYRSIRKHIGISKADLAVRLNDDPGRLAAFEGGLIPTADLPEGFVDGLNQILRDELGKLPPTSPPSK